MSAITTHILDLARGRPAAGVAVTLEHRSAQGWQVLGQGMTDADGRLRSLLPDEFDLEVGAYRLTFRTLDYFAALGVDSFYPEITILFLVADAKDQPHLTVGEPAGEVAAAQAAADALGYGDLRLVERGRAEGVGHHGKVVDR